MSSPFPGMDPFLEDDQYWPAFHHCYVQSLNQMILPSLAERYRSKVVERVYHLEQVLFTSIQKEEHREPYIEIRQRNDSRLVTLIELISPANKTSITSRQTLQQSHKEMVLSKTNLVEIDFVLQGEPIHDFSKEKLPDRDYTVCVTRCTRPDQWEIYTGALDKRLPRFRLPFSPDDRDTVVDLQMAFARAYDQGDFANKIRYDRNPPARLSEEQKAWLDHLLREANLRS